LIRISIGAKHSELKGQLNTISIASPDNPLVELKQYVSFWSSSTSFIFDPLNDSLPPTAEAAVVSACAAAD